MKMWFIVQWRYLIVLLTRAAVANLLRTNHA